MIFNVKKKEEAFFVFELLMLLTLRSFFVNLDHKNGPKYVRECFPYLIVLKCGMIKSEFVRLYCFSPCP